jgi:hypothetical protein
MLVNFATTVPRARRIQGCGALRPPALALLRVRHEGPGGRSAEQRDELAPFLIESSTRLLKHLGLGASKNSSGKRGISITG